MHWTHFRNCPRGILAEFGDFCHFLRFLSIFHSLLLLVAPTVEMLVAIMGFMVADNILNIFSKLFPRYFISIRRFGGIFCGFKAFFMNFYYLWLLKCEIYVAIIEFIFTNNIPNLFSKLFPRYFIWIRRFRGIFCGFKAFFLNIYYLWLLQWWNLCGYHGVYLY